MNLRDLCQAPHPPQSLGIHPSVLSPTAIERDLTRLGDLFEALADNDSSIPLGKKIRDLLEHVTSSQTIGALHTLALAALAISILVFEALPAATLAFFFALPFVPGATLCAWRALDSMRSKQILAATFWIFWTSFHLTILVACTGAGIRHWPGL